MAEYLSTEGTWRGRFWLPGDPSQDQSGILTYSPHMGGLRLTLIGGFDDAVWLPTGSGSTKALSQRTTQWPVIHGIVGREPVTLLDCLATRSKSSISDREVSEQEIRVSEALIGVLLKAPDANVFSGVTIELENLTAWDNRSEVVLEIERREDIPRNARWRIAVDPVDQRTANFGDLTIELGRWYRMPSHDVRRSRLEASTFAVSQFTLRSSAPKSADEWVRKAHICQDLITLAMDAPCAVLKQTLRPSDELRADQESAARREIAVYANHVVKGDPDAPGVQVSEALFTLGTDGVEFETVVRCWLTVREQFSATCDMIVSLVNGQGTYLETQLITAVAAAEAMHEAMGFNPPIPRSEFDALKKELRKQVPANRQQWLSEKLGRNKHTLRQRLLDLAAVPDDDLMTQLLPNPQGWAEAAKRSRDLIAHGGEASTDVDLMYAITEVTTAVVLVNLLHQLDIPKDQTRYSLTTRGRLERAARLARRHW